MKSIIKGFVVLAGTIAVSFGIEALIKRYVFDPDGYNAMGYDRDGYDRDGFNKEGFDSEGYNRLGYDHKGYDRDGYDQEGFDRSGYNREGYSRKGFDRSGYDHTGRDRYGLDKKGYDASGFDREGYDVQGYNRNGVDRAGKSRSEYIKDVEEITELNLRKAYIQMQNHEFAYALRDIRVGLQKCIEDIIEHTAGTKRKYSTLDENISFCVINKVFTPDYSEKIRSAKQHCNDTLHENCEKEYNQVYFCYKILDEVLIRLQETTGILNYDND